MGSATKRGINSNPYRNGQSEQWSPKSQSILGVTVVIALFMMVIHLLSTTRPDQGDFHHVGELSGTAQKLRKSEQPTMQHEQQAKPMDPSIEMKSEDLDIKPVEQKVLKLQQELVPPKEVNAHHQEGQGIHVQAMEDYQFENILYFHHYFKGKPAVVIQDMLMAHAYAFHLNGTYGGCCARASINVERNVELLEVLGLKEALPFACSHMFHNDHIPKKVIPTEKYHSEDTRIWTPAYVAYLKSLIKYPPKNDDEFVIVAHVHRGDVTPCRAKSHGFDRYLPNQHYLDIIDMYNKPGARVEIITQSESFEPLDVFVDKGYRVHLDDDLQSLWRKLLTADVLILSRSELSLIPAVCAMGYVVYTPYWNHPLRGWDHVPEDIMIRTNGEIERLQSEKCSNIKP